MLRNWMEQTLDICRPAPGICLHCWMKTFNLRNGAHSSLDIADHSVLRFHCYDKIIPLLSLHFLFTNWYIELFMNPQLKSEEWNELNVLKFKFTGPGLKQIHQLNTCLIHQLKDDTSLILSATWIINDGFKRFY